MNATLFTALISSIPASILFFGAVTIFSKRKSLSSALQLIGTNSLLIVVLAHVCEALNIFPQMEWGLPHSAGHYLDMTSAVLGLTLFPIGYLLGALTEDRD